MTQSKDQPTGTSFIADSVIQRLIGNQPLFEAFLRRRVQDDCIAQDLLQQSFVKAIQQEHSLNNEESAMAWFYRILRNTVVDYYRSRASEDTRWNDYSNQSRVLTEDHIPSLDEVKTTVCSCMDGVLSALRPAYAELIRRLDLAGESVAEVARDLQITTNNAPGVLTVFAESPRAIEEITINQPLVPTLNCNIRHTLPSVEVYEVVRIASSPLIQRRSSCNH